MTHAGRPAAAATGDSKSVPARDDFHAARVKTAVQRLLAVD